MADYEWLFVSWFSNLIERLARVHHYVREIAATSPGYEQGTPHLVWALNNQIEKLALRTYEYTCIFLEDADKSGNRTTYYSNIRQVAQDFRELHQRLSPLPNQWAPRDLDSFVQHILEEANLHWALESANSQGDHRQPWTVALTSYYNFSHAVVPLPKRQSYGDEFELELADNPNILRIPKVEKNNPLMWPALIHELGHAIGYSRDILKEAMTLKEIQIRPTLAQLTMKPWLDEVIADLIATDLVGPAYLISFLSFADFWDLNLQRPSRSHPPVVARVDYMLERLSKKNGLALSSMPGLRRLMEREHDARLVLDFADDKERHGLFDELERAKYSRLPYAERDDVVGLANRIASLESFKSIEAPPFTISRWGLIEDLAGQLAKGIPISSRRLAEPYRAWSKGETLPDDFHKIIHSLHEVPNSVGDIVSAGTLRRLGLASVAPHAPQKEFAEQVVSLFCSSEYSNVNNRLIDVALKVTEFDSLVSKSIETAGVMKFYTKGPTDG